MPTIKSLGPTLFSLFLIFINLNCTKEYCYPDCIGDHISEILKNRVPGQASIKQYLFQGHYVYYIDPGSFALDQSYEVLNESCEVIGNLEGIGGVTILNGDDFYLKAKFIRTIWARFN